MRIRIPARGRQMQTLVLQPGNSRRPLVETPGILWIHGGGYESGMAEMVYVSRAMALVRKYGAVVVSPQYTLSVKDPYPAAMEDCYAALVYMHDHAEELGFNRNRILIGGESAGGGLAAALCMVARDRGEVRIRYQMPLYPMLDCEDTDSSRDNHGIMWNTRRNHAAWKRYLRNVEKPVSCYASPSRCTDYSNLPPAYTFVCDGEPFYCETLTYIQNLKQAGVDAHVDVYPGRVHAFDMLLPWKKKSKVAARCFEKEYEYALTHYLEDTV